MKKLKLTDLETYDGVYNVGHLVDIDGSPWVTKEQALEVLDITNSHVDAFADLIHEKTDKQK